MSVSKKLPSRIEVLDYLRGFFILIIIIDHLWRWPNLFQFVTGRGELWASAAEGFVIISGLLVGYVRGRKGLKHKFGYISKKLFSRAALLYVWACITTLALVAASWYLQYKSSIAYIPYAAFDWSSVIRDTLFMKYTHSLTHFLYLYAIFLFLSPLFIFLLRKGWWFLGILISLVGWAIGYSTGQEWLQWQILFFLPSIVGYYLDSVQVVIKRIPQKIIALLAILGLVTVLISAIVILPTPPGTYWPEIFRREPMSIARIGLSFMWFLTLVWLFSMLRTILKKYGRWVLEPFGTQSLTAYIVHSFVLTTIALLIPPIGTFWLNTSVACIAILATWIVLKIPGINNVIPK